MRSKRPIIDIVPSSYDMIMEAISVIATLVLFGITAYNYNSLPDQIPIHFNLKGEADAWGDKITIFILPVIGLLLFAGFRTMYAKPHKFNYLKTITKENAERQYTIAIRMMKTLVAIILIMFVFIVRSIIQGAQNGTDSLGISFMVISVGAIFGCITYYMRQASLE